MCSVKSGCIRSKVVELGQKWMYWGKISYNRIKNGCIRATWLYSGKMGFFRLIWLYSGKVVVFVQRWLYSGKTEYIRAKVVVFGQKWLLLGKVVVF